MKLFLSLILSFALMTQCEEPCDRNTVNRWGDENAPELMSISPLKTVYEVGDSVFFSVSLPNENTIFGSTIDLLETTNDSSAFFFLYSDSLFVENEVEILTGEQEEVRSWFIMSYNFESDNYELTVKVFLNRLGDYEITNGAEITIGNGECPDYRLITRFTNIAEGPLRFNVIPKD